MKLIECCVISISIILFFFFFYLSYRRTSDSICHGKPCYGGFDTPANEYVITMHSKSSRKFHEASTHHTCWIYVRWQWFLDTTGDVSFKINDRVSIGS